MSSQNVIKFHSILTSVVRNLLRRALKAKRSGEQGKKRKILWTGRYLCILCGLVTYLCAVSTRERTTELKADTTPTPKPNGLALFPLTTGRITTSPHTEVFEVGPIKKPA